jgi:hypothetical protein
MRVSLVYLKYKKTAFRRFDSFFLYHSLLVSSVCFSLLLFIPVLFGTIFLLKVGYRGGKRPKCDFVACRHRIYSDKNLCFERVIQKTLSLLSGREHSGMFVVFLPL